MFAGLPANVPNPLSMLGVMSTPKPSRCVYCTRWMVTSSLFLCCLLVLQIPLLESLPLLNCPCCFWLITHTATGDLAPEDINTLVLALSLDCCSHVHADGEPVQYLHVHQSVSRQPSSVLTASAS